MNSFALPLAAADPDYIAQVQYAMPFASEWIPPFGINSPWGRLCQAGGYVLMLGVGIRGIRKAGFGELGRANVRVFFGIQRVTGWPAF